MALTLPKIPTEIPCPDGDIFNFPTPADLANALTKIGQLPSKLRAYIVENREQLTDEAREEIEEVIAEIEKWKDDIADILSPYWNKGLATDEIRKKLEEKMEELQNSFGENRQKILDEINELKMDFQNRDWQAEAREAVTELIQEMHLYIPTKIAELISKITSFSFKVNILGIEIDVLRVLTKEEQERIKLQICEKIDFFYDQMPEAYKTYNGTFGVNDPKKRCQAIWSYIKSEIHDWITNGIFKLFQKLISIFDVIWDLLGLPNLGSLFTFDVAAWIEAAIGKLRKKIDDIREDLKKDDLSEQARSKLLTELNKYREDVCKSLENLSLLGFNVLDLLGGKIDSTVKTCDDVIQAYIEAFRDLAINWKKKLIFDWVKIVKKFFDAIGLGKLFDFITITFCDILKLVGFPFQVPGNLSFKTASLAAGGFIAIDETDLFSGASVVRTSAAGSVTEYLQIKDPTTGQNRKLQEGELDQILEREKDTSVANYTGDGVTDTYIIPPGKGKLRVFINGKESQVAIGVGGEALATAYRPVSGQKIRFVNPPEVGANITLIKI